MEHGMPLMRSATQRLVFAFLIAPAVPSLLAMAFPLSGKPGEGIWVAEILLPCAFGVALIPGVPLHVLFRKMRWVSLWAYMGIGVVCGFILAVLFMWNTIVSGVTTGNSTAWSSAALFAVISGFLGSLSGFAFWSIARPSREL
jgi:hypothetical protein